MTTNFLYFQICPFSRTVIYFSYSNKTLLRKIENFVTMANARALGLENLDKNVIDAALSTFKLSKYVLSCLKPLLIIFHARFVGCLDYL